MWRHLVAEFATNTSGVTWWPNLQQIQVAPHFGQIYILCICDKKNKKNTKKHKITKKHKKAKRDKKDNVKLPVAMFQPGKCEEFFIFKITSKQASTEIG